MQVKEHVFHLYKMMTDDLSKWLVSMFAIKRHMFT